MSDKEDLGSEASGSDEGGEDPLDIAIPEGEQAEESKGLSINGQPIPASHLITKEIELLLFNFKFNILQSMPFYEPSKKVKDKLLDPTLVMVRIMSEFGDTQMSNDAKRIKDFIKKMKDEMKEFRAREFIFPGHKFISVNTLMKSKLNLKFASYLDCLTLTSIQDQSSEQEENKEALPKGRYQVINYAVRQVINNIRAMVVYADLLAMLAMAQLREHSILKGAYHIRKSWKLFEAMYKMIAEVEKSGQKVKWMEDHVARGHIFFGAACFYYLISTLPGKLLFILKGFGFVSNRQLGKTLLKRALDQEAGNAYYSGLFVLWISGFMDEDEKKTEQLLERLFKLTEHSPLYSYFAGHMYMNLHVMEKGLFYFKKALDQSGDAKILKDLNIIEIGLCEMLVEDYEKAEKTLEFVMKENKGKSWYIWQYGVCLWQLGKHDKAIAAFKKSKEQVRKGYTWDEYAGRKSAEFLKAKKIPANEGILLKAYNAMRCGDEVRAGKYLDKFEEVLESQQADLVSYYYFIRGKYWRKVGESQKAHECWDMVNSMKNEVKREKWLAPYALLKKINLWHKDKMANEAMVHAVIKEIDKFKEYNFDKAMKRKLINLKEKMKMLEVEHF